MYKVVYFPDGGACKPVYFATEEAARVYANAAHIVYPDTAVFVLRNMPGFTDTHGAPLYELIDQFG